MSSFLEENSIGLGMSVMFLAVAFITTLSVLYFVKQNQKNFKSPLNVKLLRQPGETIQLKIESINLDIFANLIYIPLAGIIFFVQYMTMGKNTSVVWQLILWGIFFVFAVYIIIKTVRLSIERNKLRVGLEAERAIGDALNKLVYARNAIVFHDFQAEKFNIDHVLITEKGVFAIETKGRSKNKTISKNYAVTYKNNQLHFPEHIETNSLRQSSQQAKWLACFLSEKLKKDIPVKAVLAIPGWFIERKQPHDQVILVNGKGMDFLFKSTSCISENDINAISGIIEERCFNDGELSYKESKKSLF